MRRRLLVPAVLVLSAVLLALLPAAAGAQVDDARILVFSKTAGFRHSSIPTGIATIQALGEANGVAVDATEDADDFTEANLARYDAVVWLSTTGDVLDAEQQAAFEAYVADGGGYAGIHAAADTEYGWAWYGEHVGAYFVSHPANQTATVDVVDDGHPSTAHLPAEWSRYDEWYNYRESPSDTVHVLATLDEDSYDPGSNAMGDDHPIAWCQVHDGGRSWYTGGGHTEASYGEEAFAAHLLGGIAWAAGLADGDCPEPEPGPDPDPDPEPEPGCLTGGSDEFDGDALDTSRWSTIVRESADAYEVSDGALRITTENGDLWQTNNTARNLMLQPAPDGDWQITTEVSIDATGGSQQAGLMLHAGDDDYLKLGHIGRDGAKWFEFIIESGGTPRWDSNVDRSANLPAGFPTTFQLRMTSVDGTVTGAYSTDEGATWTSVGRPADTTVLDDPRVGVFALTNDANQVTEAVFDWVHLSGEGVVAGPSDEFDGDALDACRWDVVRENPDSLEVSDGALRITTDEGDLWEGNDDARNLVVQPLPGGGWEATAAVSIDATGGSEQAGLLFYGDDANYAKFGHIGRDGARWFELVWETGGSPRFDSSLDRTPNLPADFPTSFWQRFTYDEGILSASYSIDEGATWVPVGRPADTTGVADPQFGVFALTNDPNEVTEAAFDWFRVETSDGEDTSPPSVSTSVDGLPTSTGEWLGEAEVTVEASDFGSGVDTVEVAVGDGDWMAYDGPITISEAGDTVVRARATDLAGNTSAESTTTVTVAAAPDCEPVTPEPGYTAVYDGTIESLSGWSMAGPGGFDPGDDCTIDAWGGMGLLWYSAEELTSPYTVRAEWKIYSDDDNSGIFIGFPDPGDDPWQPVSQGYEIQIDPTDEAVRTTGAVYSFQAPDEEARAEALNGYGEWNVLEVTVDDPQITVRLNGVVINEYTSNEPERDLSTGYIGIQNDGAGRDVTYRSVQIREGDGEPVDETAPSVDVALSGEEDGEGRYTTPVTATVSADDEDGGSGLASVEVSVDGGDWVAYEGPVTLDGVGDHTIAARATDAAGNVGEASAAFAIVEPEPEPEPECPDPDGGATVVIGGVDSGVPNRDVGAGCTIDDLLDDEASWGGRTRLLRHVADVAHDLQAEGVVDARERAALIRAAVSAGRPARGR